jgi:hypothetical protein
VDSGNVHVPRDIALPQGFALGPGKQIGIGQFLVGEHLDGGQELAEDLFGLRENALQRAIPIVLPNPAIPAFEIKLKCFVGCGDDLTAFGCLQIGDRALLVERDVRNNVFDRPVTDDVGQYQSCRANFRK